MLDGIHSWEHRSDDPYASLVINRALTDRRLGTYNRIPDLPGPSSPDTLKSASSKALSLVRGTDEYQRILDHAEYEFWFHSSLSKDDMANPERPYTADDMINALKEAVGVDAFKESASYCSYRLNVVMKEAGEKLFELEPEILRSQADRQAFEMKMDERFVPAPNAVMNDHQLHRLLQGLAADLNRKYSLPTS